jgi:hypothetical protein
VDDLMLFASSDAMMEHMKNTIKSEWEVTDLREPRKITPFAVLVCLTIWNNPVKPMTTSRDFATATFCPSLWIDPHYPH